MATSHVLQITGNCFSQNNSCINHVQIPQKTTTCFMQQLEKWIDLISGCTFCWMCAYYYSTNFTHANLELTKKRHLKKPLYQLCAQCGLHCGLSHQQDQIQLSLKALDTCPGQWSFLWGTWFWQIGSDKWAGVEDSGPRVWYNFTLGALHWDMQDSLSKRSLPKKLVTGTVSDDWRIWTGKVRGNVLKNLTEAFLFSTILIQSCSKYEHCWKDMQSSGFENHPSKLVNSPLAGSKERVMDSSWERVD